MSQYRCDCGDTECPQCGTMQGTYSGLDVAARRRHAIAYVRRMPRAQLIAFCVWNDPNGCYTDAECRLEFGHVARISDLQAIVIAWIQDGADISCATLREHGGAHE